MDQAFAATKAIVGFRACWTYLASFSRPASTSGNASGSSSTSSAPRRRGRPRRILLLMLQPPSFVDHSILCFVVVGLLDSTPAVSDSMVWGGGVMCRLLEAPCNVMLLLYQFCDTFSSIDTVHLLYILFKCSDSAPLQYMYIYLYCIVLYI